MTQVHFPTKEYETLLKILDYDSKFHVIVLDCGIAGIVNYIKINDTIYYEDYFYSHDTVLNTRYLDQDNDELYAEVYQKMALTNLFYA